MSAVIRNSGSNKLMLVSRTKVYGVAIKTSKGWRVNAVTVNTRKEAIDELKRRA